MNKQDKWSEQDKDQMQNGNLSKESFSKCLVEWVTLWYAINITITDIYYQQLECLKKKMSGRIDQKGVT